MQSEGITLTVVSDLQLELEFNCCLLVIYYSQNKEVNNIIYYTYNPVFINSVYIIVVFPPPDETFYMHP